MLYLFCYIRRSENARNNTMDDIYNLAVILDDYCNNHSDNENISHILPLVKILLDKIDKLNVRGYI